MIDRRRVVRLIRLACLSRRRTIGDFSTPPVNHVQIGLQARDCLLAFRNHRTGRRIPRRKWLRRHGLPVARKVPPPQSKPPLVDRLWGGFLFLGKFSRSKSQTDLCSYPTPLSSEIGGGGVDRLMPHSTPKPGHDKAPRFRAGLRARSGHNVLLMCDGCSILHDTGSATRRPV